MVEFSEWLRRARRAQQMTADELAEAAGLSRWTIHSWEQRKAGKVLRNPSPESLERIERALGLTAADYPFDGASLADALESEGVPEDAEVDLYCRETRTGLCFVGYRVPGGGERGACDGEGVRSLRTGAGLAARILRRSDG